MSTDPAQDADPAVKPQVIDLDAVDVTTADASATSGAEEPTHEAPKSEKPRPSHRNWLWVVAALVVGAALGGWIYRDMLSSYLPSSAMTVMADRIGAMEVTNKSLAQQVQAASAAADAAQQKAAGLESAVKDAAAASGKAATTESALEQRLAAVEKTLADSKADIGKLRASLTAAPGGGGTPDAAAIAAITQRLDALEKDVAALKAGAGITENAAMVSSLRQALAGLEAKIAAGAPYRDDLDQVLRMVPAAGGNDLLASYADNGLPNAQGLAAELRSAARSLPHPQESAAPTGYLASLWSTLASIVTIRDVGEIDWPALAEESAKLAEGGKLDQAIATLDGAQASVPEALARWRERAAARIKLETAASELAKAVELTLAARGGGN
jgi:hypothetical protein